MNLFITLLSIFMIICFCTTLILVVLITYTLIQNKREKIAAGKIKITGCCHYRLNDYFVINRYLNGKSYLNMDMCLPAILVSWGLCLGKRRKSIYVNFLLALKKLESDLVLWSKKNSEDIYITTNPEILKRIKECECNGIIHIKQIVYAKPYIQFIEQLSICNHKHQKKEIYKLLISVANIKETRSKYEISI